MYKRGNKRLYISLAKDKCYGLCGWMGGWTAKTSGRSITDHFTSQRSQTVLLKDSPASQMAFCISEVTQFHCS